MAYEINRRTEADYRWFRFEAGNELLDSLDHNLKIADGVLRFRIFKVDPGTPTIVPPADHAPHRARASAARQGGPAPRAATSARRPLPRRRPPSPSSRPARDTARSLRRNAPRRGEKSRRPRS